MLDEDKIAQLRGAKLVAQSSEVGEIEEIYAHSSDDRPALACVKAEGRRVLVPLPDADVSGDRITVAFGADAIAGAPEPSGDVIADEEFTRVYEHFGISDATMREDSGTGGTGRADQGMSDDPRPGGADDASQGHP